MIPSNIFKAASEGQLLGLIFFGLLFWVLCGPPKSKGKRDPTGVLGKSQRGYPLNHQVDYLVCSHWCFWLVTPTLMQVGFETLGVMGKFAGTVLLGLAIHALVVLPLLLWILGKLISKAIIRQWLQLS